MAKTEDKVDWSLKTFSDGLEAQASRREAERAEWQQRIGEPTLFLPSENTDTPGHGVGYWKCPEGVFSARRYSNGYDINSVVCYSHDFINLLLRVRGY